LWWTKSPLQIDLILLSTKIWTVESAGENAVHRFKKLIAQRIYRRKYEITLNIVKNFVFLHAKIQEL